MQKRRFAIVAMVAAFLLAGCESLGGPKQTGGTLVGAAAGGLLSDWNALPRKSRRSTRAGCW